MAVLFVLLLLVVRVDSLPVDFRRFRLLTLSCELLERTLTRSDRSVMVRIASKPDPRDKDMSEV
jgi:hypothetical protein